MSTDELSELRDKINCELFERKCGAEIGSLKCDARYGQCTNDRHWTRSEANGNAVIVFWNVTSEY